MGGTGEEAPGRPQGGAEEAPGRPRGGNGALVAPPYEVLRTTNEVSEALTRRWAVGPANQTKGSALVGHLQIWAYVILSNERFGQYNMVLEEPCGPYSIGHHMA